MTHLGIFFAACLVAYLCEQFEERYERWAASKGMTIQGTGHRKNGE